MNAYIRQKREHSTLNSFKCIGNANFMLQLRAIVIVQKRRWYHHIWNIILLADQIYVYKDEFIYKQSESKLHWRCQFHAQVRGQLWYEVITSVENGLWVPSTPPLDWANLAHSLASGLARACYNILLGWTTQFDSVQDLNFRLGIQVKVMSVSQKRLPRAVVYYYYAW